MKDPTEEYFLVGGAADGCREREKGSTEEYSELGIGFSPCRYLHDPLRLLPAGATVAGRASQPAEKQRLSTAH